MVILLEVARPTVMSTLLTTTLSPVLKPVLLPSHEAISISMPVRITVFNMMMES